MNISQYDDYDDSGARDADDHLQEDLDALGRFPQILVKPQAA